MKQKPILLFLPTPPPYAGPEVASDLLLRALAKLEGVEVVHVRSNVRQDNRAKGNFNFSGIVSFARVYGRLLGAIIRHRPSALCFLLSSNRVGFIRDSTVIFTGWLFRCRVTGHYRGAHFDKFYRLSSPTLKWFVRTVLKMVDGIIVQAAALRNMFAGLFPLDGIAVLPNGLDFDGWNLPTRIQSERVRLLFVGHLTFAKGFYDLIVAYDELRARHPQIELWFAGEFMDNERQKFRVAELLDGDDQKYFFDHVTEISDRIKSFMDNEQAHDAKYLGRIAGDEKRSVFESADIFVLPSYTEGFSMAVLEAMGYGLPIVATKVGALPEVLQDGVHGFLVDRRDPKALADRLEKLIQSPSLRKQIGDSNAAHARASYDINLVGRQLLRILSGKQEDAAKIITCSST
ncbi:MAG: glycosyltransferase family 1 protein [Verrucomicrobiae bacterium]|nr:glycosyltransferase family 1 protein [Verrucomicrobiae bacterium]